MPLFDTQTYPVMDAEPSADHPRRVVGMSHALGMVTRPPGDRMFGRELERDALQRRLDQVRSGHSAVLVVHGEPGVGKTALLEWAIEVAPDFRVARTVGVDGEIEFAFAALQRLCAPFLGFAERLPPPQRDALAVAFGLSSGIAPNPFLVGLAVLGVLSQAAEEQSLLCLVDDAQWLDRASARSLAFVARRLLAERIALVFATRKLADVTAGLPELSVQPLARSAARALLESELPAPLDERVLERLGSETRGTPLPPLELPRGLTPAQLAGGFGLPAAAPLSASIEGSFARRLAMLSNDARRLLLLAAADPVGDPGLVWRAAESLGIPDATAETVEAQGLLAFAPQVMFRHPLVRSAVYGGATVGERREVHRALADATDPAVDPDRRAWHRAQAASRPDETIATDLERSAARAQARGGFAAAAAFLARAAALTLDQESRARRQLAAAQAMFRSGALDEALELLTWAEVGGLDEPGQAHAELLRARVAFVSTHGSDAPPLLLRAARRLQVFDPALAREIYLEAMSAAMFAGRLASPGGSSREVAQAARAASAPAVARGPDVLLDGLATLFGESYQAAVPILRRAQDAFDVARMPTTEQLRWKWLATVSAVHLWDDERWLALSERHVQIARQVGALAELPLALNQRVYLHLFAGELTAAAGLVGEIAAATEATGTDLAPYGEVGLLAVRGNAAEATQLIDRSRTEVARRGEGIGLSALDWAEAVLYNGLGRYEEARASALRVTEHPHDLSTSNWGLA